jgi:hypothetical protein
MPTARMVTLQAGLSLYVICDSYAHTILLYGRHDLTGI